MRDGDLVSVAVKDNGKGIFDVKKAMEPLFTSKAEMERSGMGFTIMESFADNLQVESEPNVGTVITFSKKFYSVRCLKSHRVAFYLSR